MASSLLSEEPFLCPICLEVFTDPVSTPCGHNYCNACITRHWDASEVCACPLCQAPFDSRPKLSVNKVLSEMADQFRRKPANRKMYLIVTLLLNLLLTLTLCRSFTEPDQAAPQKEDCEGKKAELRKTELRREIAELEERSSELRRLLRTDDPLHMLLLNSLLSVHVPPPTRDRAKVRVVRDRPSYAQTVRTVVETLRKDTEEKRCDAELRTVRQYAVDEALDPEAARLYPILPEDAKRANRGHEKDDVERFSHLQVVVGKQSFSSGRFYYEVQVGGKANWDLGVAREVINGHRPITLSPDSHWAIRMRDGSRCYAAADPDVLLPAREELQTVGVFVDYEEGVVSFYDVEARVHLYSFTGCTFTEELYPYFSQYFHRDGTNSGQTGRLFVISLCSFLVYIYRRR